MSNLQDRKNLNNYQEVDKLMFDEIYDEIGNKDGKLKMIDNLGEIRYFVWTKFLVNQ